VTLTGQVDWIYQRREAEHVARHTRGVRGVRNHIVLKPKAIERAVRHRIVEALHRNANVDARHITVTVVGDRAILTGTAGTSLQRETAERAAAAAPGIAQVENRIAVDPRRDDVDELC